MNRRTLLSRVSAAAAGLILGLAGLWGAMQLSIPGTPWSGQADLLVLAGFLKLIPEAVVRSHRGRILNIHPALLPAYPGLDTHQRKRSLVILLTDFVHGQADEQAPPQSVVDDTGGPARRPSLGGGAGPGGAVHPSSSPAAAYARMMSFTSRWRMTSMASR